MVLENLTEFHVEIFVAVVVYGVQVDRAVEFILVEGNMVVESVFHPALDGIYVLIGAKSVELGGGRFDGADVDAFGVGQR